MAYCQCCPKGDIIVVLNDFIFNETAKILTIILTCMGVHCDYFHCTRGEYRKNLLRVKKSDEPTMFYVNACFFNVGYG